jgi:hypothetical protein
MSEKIKALHRSLLDSIKKMEFINCDELLTAIMYCIVGENKNLVVSLEDQAVNYIHQISFVIEQMFSVILGLSSTIIGCTKNSQHINQNFLISKIGDFRYSQELSLNSHHLGYQKIEIGESHNGIENDFKADKPASSEALNSSHTTKRTSHHFKMPSDQGRRISFNKSRVQNSSSNPKHLDYKDNNLGRYLEFI